MANRANSSCPVDLAVTGTYGRTGFASAAYLAPGSEYLDHATCELGVTFEVDRRDDPRQKAKSQAVWLHYPTSGGGHPTETKQIPIGDLVIVMSSSYEEQVLRNGGPVTLLGSKGFAPFYVGVPASVYAALWRMISEEAQRCDGAFRSDRFWHPQHASSSHGHWWLFADVDEHLKATVCIDGRRRDVDVQALAKQLNSNLKCDAFVTISLVRPHSASTPGSWRMGITITEVLVTDTTAVRTSLLRSGELVGRQEASLAQIASGFAQLQKAQEGGPRP